MIIGIVTIAVGGFCALWGWDRWKTKKEKGLIASGVMARVKNAIIQVVPKGKCSICRETNECAHITWFRVIPVKICQRCMSSIFKLFKK